MAILEDVPGLGVEIRCNNRPLPEHDDPNGHDHEDAAAPTSAKFIECVDNTTFEVHISIDRDYEWGYRNHVVVATTWVDGKRIRGSIIRKSDMPFNHDPIRRCIKGNEICDLYGGWSLRKFQFSSVKTTDDARKERIEQDMGVAKDLGVIEVKFDRAIEYGPAVSGRTADINTGAFELAEKSLKGKSISHGTSYGAAEPISAPAYVDCRNIVEDNGPIAIFHFRYQSREALKRELIIPRSPTRSPTLEYLSPEDIERLARERLNDLRNAKVKKEDKNIRNPPVKRERDGVLDLTGNAPPAIVRPIKKSRLNDGRVVDAIDLTDD